MFFRSYTDRDKVDCTKQFINSCAGPEPTPIWIIGGGPSLFSSPESVKLINQSSIPKFCVNYSGRGKQGGGWIIKPDYWTSFDGTSRFHKSIFLDPSITKFVKQSRTHDLIPNTTHKVCDAPKTYFVTDERRGFSNFFDQSAEKLNHSLDSFILALDIAFRLGYRIFYCVGCELIIQPSEEQVKLAQDNGVKYENGEVHWTNDDGKHVSSDRLRDFVDRCAEAGIGNQEDAHDTTTKRRTVCEEMSKLTREKQYSFDETKGFTAAMHSDTHYWERVQYLRLSRKNMSLNGIQLISCTPNSRLNPWFPYMNVPDVVWKHELLVEEETTYGAYTNGTVNELELPFHSDVKPYGWEFKKRQEKKGGCKGCGDKKKQQEEKQPVDNEQINKIQQIRIAGNKVDIQEEF